MIFQIKHIGKTRALWQTYRYGIAPAIALIIEVYWGQNINFQSRYLHVNISVSDWKLESHLQFGISYQYYQVEWLNYCEISNIRCTFAGNTFVDHIDVVGALPAGAAPTTSSFST